MRLSRCNSCANRLSGITDIIAPLTGALTSGSSGGGSAMPGTGVTTTVSPPIQVSPQISPIFQQQFQPSNSPISAGTSQVAPMSPQQITPNPAFDTGAGYGTPTYGATPGTPFSPQLPSGQIPMPVDVANASLQPEWQKYIPWAIGGVIALAAIKFMSGKRARNARK